MALYKGNLNLIENEMKTNSIFLFYNQSISMYLQYSKLFIFGLSDLFRKMKKLAECSFNLKYRFIHVDLSNEKKT